MVSEADGKMYAGTSYRQRVLKTFKTRGVQQENSGLNEIQIQTNPVEMQVLKCA